MGRSMTRRLPPRTWKGRSSRCTTTTAVGLSPSDIRVKPGTHLVRFQLFGFATEHRTLAADAGHVTVVTAVLPRVAWRRPALRAAQRPAHLASPLNYMLGAALVVAALPAIVMPLDALAGAGSCAGQRDGFGRCGETVYFGSRSGVMLAAGVLSLAVGVGLLWATPLSLDVSASREGGRLAVAGRM